MGTSPVIDASRAFLGSLVRLYLAGMFVCAAWALWRLITRQTILPEKRLVPTAPTPWGPATIWVVLVVAVLSHLAVGKAYYSATGRAIEQPVAGDPVLGGEHDKAALVDQAKGDAKPAKRASGTEIEQLGLMAAGNFVLLLLLPGVLRLSTRHPFRDLGISSNQWPRQVAYGVGGMLVATPLVYGFQAGAVWAMKQMGSEPAKHKVQELLEGQFSLGMVLLTLVTTDILAPVVEEVLFRGLLQRWLIRVFHEKTTGFSTRALARRRPLAQQAGAEPEVDRAELAPVDGGEMSEPRSNQHAVSDVINGGQTAELASEAAKPALVGWRYATAAGIVATAFLFGAVHAPAWPAPIAIFVLAIGMGVVYERTGSLLASIVMHGAFNGLGTVTMFLQLLAPREEGKPANLPPASVQISPGPTGSLHAVSGVAVPSYDLWRDLR